MTGKLLGSLAVFVCMLSPPAYADALHSDAEHQLVTHLLDWLDEQNVFTDKNIEHPQINFVAASTLCRMASGTKRIENQAACPDIIGLYNNETKTIYLNYKVDINSPSGQAILLHELVHHVQFSIAHPTHTLDRREIEAEAYALESKFHITNKLPVSY
jgi:hypothetical protein